MDHRGSRRHILDWLEQPSFLSDLNELLRPLPVVIGEKDLHMPAGRRGPGGTQEARLETFGPRVIPTPDVWASLRRWWLRHAGNTPNWDYASSCTLEGRRGLLLVEAKANVPELSTAGKRLVGRAKKNGREAAPPSENANANDDHIRQAVSEAGRALAALGVAKAFTASSHYQLVNRLAFTWKLASLGVPVTLMYLGFCGDHGLASEPFATEEHWYSTLRTYLRPCIEMVGRDLRFDVDGIPVWITMRARSVLFQSPPAST